MAGDTVITIIGNLTADPELRFTPSGAAVANFTVASTPRMFDRNNNEWKDGETLFLRCSIWRDAAENVAESLQKGMRVIASGRLKSRSYETKEGEKRTVIELEVDEIGPSLRSATAKVNRTQRGGGGGYGGGAQQQGGGWSGQQQGGGDDPWAGAGRSDSGGGWGGKQQGGGWGQPGAASSGQPGGGQQGAGQTAGGQQGGWGSNAPNYDEPPF
ncbi:single-stranded DNA-binding protein [Intrasporangium sp.]|uniref:single-stranded DNA-binding protein n=1 Tax=Intrasporangium sp. TaxID=1925024 RepID=UPI0032219E43